MSDVIEVSYTGDLLAHRRCPRAWAYGKRAGFHPYEQVQAMEGRLVHHAMEWLTREFRRNGDIPRPEMLRAQLTHYFRILWARGIRTAFDRVMGHLYPSGQLDDTVQRAIEGALHSEYELRAVRNVLPDDFGGKSKILLTGIIDLVLQEHASLTYERHWVWTSASELDGGVRNQRVAAVPGDIELWDYKATRSSTRYVGDYARQLLTYAALYRDRSGDLPARCVLFFVNEPDASLRLLAIDVTSELVDAAIVWTKAQAASLQASAATFENDPQTLQPGEFPLRHLDPADRITDELRQQCTACGLRFDCNAYVGHVGGRNHPDVDILNVLKN
jgi:hypothetical protein